MSAMLAIGVPTQGTWDVDYARRLRDRAPAVPGSDSEDDGNDFVVLPPPERRLDPVTQRAKWRKEAFEQAREKNRRDARERDMFNFEQFTEEPEPEVPDREEEEEDEDVDDEDEEEHEVEENAEENNGEDKEKVEEELADEQQMLAEIANGTGDDEQGEEVDWEAKYHITGDKDVRTSELENDAKEKYTQGDADPSPAFATVFTKADCVPVDKDSKSKDIVEQIHKSDWETIYRPQSTTNDVDDDEDKDKKDDIIHENVGSNVAGKVSEANKPASVIAIAPLQLDKSYVHRSEFLEDQAEDEDGDNDCDSDRDSEHDELDRSNPVVGDEEKDDADAEAEAAAGGEEAAAFHRHWQKQDEHVALAAIAAGRPIARRNAILRPRRDDNATDLTEFVAAAAAKAASSGETTSSGFVAATISLASDAVHGNDYDEDNEDVLNMAKTSTDNYVDNMLRMRNDESLFANERSDGEVDGECGAAGEERRARALVVWKSRQKRNTTASFLQDRADLSRCGFLEDDTNIKRDQYRAQYQRACGLNNNSRDGFELSASAAASASLSPSRSLPGGKPLVSSFDEAFRSRPHSLSLRLGKSTSRQPPITIHEMPEWERRRVCLERKEIHRKSGTSIGKWAFASERSTSSPHIAPGVAKPNSISGLPAASGGASAAGGNFRVRRKRPRVPPPEATPVVPASKPTVNLPTTGLVAKKKAKHSGLLDLLGNRPTAN
jgi:hypothetical protein